MQILIVKIGAIGDVVMTLPILTHIRTHYPKAQITWICGDEVSPLLDTTKLIDHIIPINEKALFTSSRFTQIITVIKCWLTLFTKKFDLCLTFHSDPRYRWLTFPIRCKEKRFWNRGKERLIPIPGRYHAHEVLRLFTGQDGPDNVPIYFPKLTLKKIVPLSSKPTIILAPGGAKNILATQALRRWPITSYALLMKYLANYPIQLVVTGTESDAWVAEFFTNIDYVNLIGKLSLIELLATLESSQLLITHDSGPLHLTKLTHCPAIGLFGPTNPFEKMCSQENINILWGGVNLSCRPCYDGKTYAPCTQNKCLSSISPETVLSKALDLLKIAPHPELLTSRSESL